MAKYPSEIFGYYYLDSSKEARKARNEHLCPFMNEVCNKQSRLIEIPFGVCTAHFEGQELALCPRRFREHEAVFNHIAEHHFNSINNLLVFSEVRLKGIGNFDFVMVRHKPLSTKIEDFVVIEFQTGQTTNTGKLVDGFKDFMNHNKFRQSTYGFGINDYDIWKRTFTQILNKGIILEKWGKKIFWAAQDGLFKYFLQKYRLIDIGYNKENSTVLSFYDLEKKNNCLNLKSTKMLSSTIDNLFKLFRKNDHIPPVEDFIKNLEKKVKMGAQIDLSLKFK